MAGCRAAPRGVATLNPSHEMGKIRESWEYGMGRQEDMMMFYIFLEKRDNPRMEPRLLSVGVGGWLWEEDASRGRTRHIESWPLHVVE